jgi:hypothetical protein
MGETVGFGAVILGGEADEFEDLWLTADTRVAVLATLEEHEKVRPFLPPAYCGTVRADAAVAQNIDMGDGWHVNMYLHNEVVERHGAVTWGRAEGLTRTLQGIDAPILWAWDAGQRLVCIGAPIAPAAAGQASRP